MSLSRREQRRQQNASDSEHRSPAWCVMARGVATFFGLFLLYDVFVSRGAGFPWWFEFTVIPDRLLRGVFTFYSVGLMFYGLSGREPKALRIFTRVLTCLILLLVLTSIFDWYELRRQGLLDSPVQVPFLLQIAGILTVILAGLFQSPIESERNEGLLVGIIAFDLCVLLVPIAHVYCVGQSSNAQRLETLLIFAETPFDQLTADALSRKLNGVLNSEGERQALISGSPERVREWQQWLQKQTERDSMTVLTSAAPLQPQELLAQLSRRRSSGLVVVGSPTRLAQMQISFARSEIPITQIALNERPLKLSSVLRSIPNWWKAYLVPVGADRTILPTVSIPSSESE